MADLVDKIRATVRHAQEQAKEILKDPKTVILDTETTGLVDGSRIVDLAVIARNKTLINTLIDPGKHIPIDASRIHGIFDKDVNGAPTFTEIWPSLEKILRTRRVVIYNAPYDLRVISDEAERDGIPIGPNEYPHVEDALILYQAWYFGGAGRSGKGQTKLTTAHCDSPACLAAVSHHEQAGSHRAYADCLATVERLKMIANSCWLHDHYRGER